MKALVTGSGGFIASFLIPRLIKEGFEVIGFERFKPTYGLETEIKTYYGDLVYFHSIAEVIKKEQPEVVCHLAAISTADIFAYENWEEVIHTNIIGTANLIEALRRYDLKLKKFVFASSSEVYGNQDKFPITENMVFKPNSPYAVSKASSELYLYYCGEAYNFPYIILRPFNTYGKIPRRTVVEKITLNMLLQKPEIRLGSRTAVRDFLFVDDHVEGYIKAINSEITKEIFNLCTGRGTSIEELVNIVKGLTNYKGNIIWSSMPPRPNDTKILIGSYEKAKNILGWFPKYSLEDGIKRMIECYTKK